MKYLILVFFLFTVALSGLAQEEVAAPAVEGDEMEVIDGKAIYKARCSACHKIGGGKLVGPDLKGVTERRSEDWVKGFIKNSQAMIEAGDKDAIAIFDEYNKVMMPAHPDLTDDQLTALIRYINTGGEGDIAGAGEAGSDRASAIAAAPVAGLAPTDSMFQLIFWFSAALIVFMVLFGGYLISRFSK